MKDKLHNQLREKVLLRHYVITLHADEEMDNDGLSILDVEHVLLTGTIIETQKDRHTSETKYVIKGGTLSKDEACVVCKLGMTGKLVIITVYKESPYA